MAMAISHNWLKNYGMRYICFFFLWADVLVLMIGILGQNCSEKLGYYQVTYVQ
jgi:hypothetical protein